MWTWIMKQRAENIKGKKYIYIKGKKKEIARAEPLDWLERTWPNERGADMELDESRDSEGKENQHFQVQVDGYILWYKNVLFPYGSLYFHSDTSIRNKASVEGGKKDDYGDLRKTKTKKVMK